MPEMERRRHPLSQEYLDPGRTALRGAVSRQILAIMLVCTPMFLAAKLLDVLGDDLWVVQWVTAMLVLAGAAGGALYHPVRRFWWRGTVSGVVVTAGAFAAYRTYQRLRPDPFGYEFAIVALMGAVPGLLVYYLLMRQQHV